MVLHIVTITWGYASGELCLVEVFGKDRVPRRSAQVGMGIKQLNDPRLTDDFEAPRLPIDVGQWHEYAVRWDEVARPTLNVR